MKRIFLLKFILLISFYGNAQFHKHISKSDVIVPEPAFEIFGHPLVSFNTLEAFNNGISGDFGAINMGFGLGAGMAFLIKEDFKLVANAETSTSLISREYTEAGYEKILNYELEFEDVPNFSIIENNYTIGLVKVIQKTNRHYTAVGPQLGLSIFKKKVQGYSFNPSGFGNNAVVVNSIKNVAPLFRLMIFHKIHVKRIFNDFTYKYFGSLSYSRKHYDETILLNFRRVPNQVIVVDRKINHLSLVFGVGFSFS